MTNLQMADIIMRDLQSLSPYYYCKAVSGSIYIKFEDVRIRSLRIADHKGISRYRYKWNLLSYWQLENKIVDHDYVRFYYNFNDYQEFVEHILNYEKAIKRNERNEI